MYFFQGVIKYVLPLRSCNTMSTDVTEGMEYFNTVVVQPHRYKILTYFYPVFNFHWKGLNFHVS